MSVSILEVIEHGGWDVQNNVDDARWLVSQVNQFEELVTQAEDLIEKIEDEINEQLEKEYNERMGGDE